MSRLRKEIIFIESRRFFALTFYSIITTLKYHVFENIMENGAFALLKQMLHFPKCFQKYSKLNLISSRFFFQCCLKIENDIMIKNSLWSNGGEDHTREIIHNGKQ